MVRARRAERRTKTRDGQRSARSASDRQRTPTETTSPLGCSQTLVAHVADKTGWTYSLVSGASLLSSRRSLSLPPPARESRSLLRLRSRVVDDRCECRSLSSSRLRSRRRLSSASSSSRNADRQSFGFSFLDSLTDELGSASPYGRPSSGSIDRSRLDPAKGDIQEGEGQGGEGDGRQVRSEEVGRGGGGGGQQACEKTGSDREQGSFARVLQGETSTAAIARLSGWVWWGKR